MDFEHDLAASVRAVLTPYLTEDQLNNFRVIPASQGYSGTVDFHCEFKVGSATTGLVLTLVTRPAEKQVLIPSIVVPQEMKHQGIGKKMIAAVYAVCNVKGYDLFIVDLVPSFFRRLKNRGARAMSDDVVQITTETKLD